MKTKSESLNQVKENNPQEYSMLYLFACEWIKKQSRSFTSEDIKTAYYAAGNPQLKQCNVVGTVMHNLGKDGLITKCGYSEAKLLPAHGRIIARWRTVKPSQKLKPLSEFNLFSMQACENGSLPI